MNCELYKLKLTFESDIVGVYTTEEETVNDYWQMKSKKTIMLKRWAKILDKNIAEIFNQTDNEINLIIQNRIDLLNKNDKGQQERKFELCVYGDGKIIYDFC